AVAQADKRFYYSLDTTVRVLGSDGKEIFSRQQKLAKYLTHDELDPLKGKPVIYEGWVPLAPGKDMLKFVFTNLLTKTSFPSEREVAIPAFDKDFVVPDPVPFSQADAADPAKADALPFTGGGIRFRPYVVKDLALAQGQDLKFFYQI